MKASLLLAQPYGANGHAGIWFRALAEFARNCPIASPHAAKSDSTVQLPAS
jgi:hypothetical protein